MSIGYRNSLFGVSICRRIDLSNYRQSVYRSDPSEQRYLHVLPIEKYNERMLEKHFCICATLHAQNNHSTTHTFMTTNNYAQCTPVFKVSNWSE